MDGPCDGRFNMATDLALLQACDEAPDAPPALRVYGWSGPALSVGHSQNIERDVDLAQAEKRGVPIVRRPTGGRALLHHREVTYAVVAPFGGTGLRSHLKDIFDDVARYLTAGLVELGLPEADVAFQNVPQRRRAGRRSAACFAELHFGEITVRGKKLVGSAQKRARNAFLQHGSIPLEEDIALFISLCRYGSGEERREEERALRSGTTTLRQELGSAVSFERAAGALVSGFNAGGVFNLEPDGLTRRECELRDAILEGS